MKYIIAFALILVSFSTAHTQTREFRGVLRKPVIGRHVRTTSVGSESDQVFLGTVTDSKGRSQYLVVREFYTVQAAITKHGHSRVLIFNPHKKLIAQYILNMPDELPYKLHHNILYFHYRDYDTTKFSSEELLKQPWEYTEDSSHYTIRTFTFGLEAGLPDWLCTGPDLKSGNLYNGCYSKSDASSPY